jgi:hypothetical protein
MTSVAPSRARPGSGVDAENPWPGLVAFTEELQAYFYGRDEEADELLRRVERRDLTVLFGQSGLGKSSLLHAGLFPRLRANGYLPVAIRLDHAATAPPLAEQVKAAVNRAIQDAGGQIENATPEASETLWQHFHRRNLLLQMPEGQPARLVLALDQFEELFALGYTSAATRERTARFLTELADLIEKRVPEFLERRFEESPELVKQYALADRGYRALICLREDYLPHLESLQPSMPAIAENRMRLTRMSGLRALEAVIGPGAHLISRDIGRQVVRFVAGGGLPESGTDNGQDEGGLAGLEVEPALLCLVCRELNTRRQALGLPQITADLLAGSREGILQDYYERCMADQPPAVRVFVEDELVTDSGLRENIALERARKTLTQHGAPAEAIDELVKRRLLHLEERLDIQRVELTHDVLTTVVKKSRDQRQQEESVLRAQRQAQEIRERARRQRTKQLITAAIVAGAVLAVVATGAAYYANREREYAVREEIKANEASLRANENYKTARDAIGNVVTTFVQGFKDSDGIKVKTIEDVLVKTKEAMDTLEKQSKDDPEVKRIRASMDSEFAKAFQNSRNLNRALAEAEVSLQIRAELVELPEARPEWRADWALSLEQVGDIRREIAKGRPADDPEAANQFSAARELFEQARTIREQLHSTQSGDPLWAFLLSQILVRIADLKVIPEKDYAGAQKDYQAALTLIIEVVGRDPVNVKWQRELAWDLSKVGDILCLTKDTNGGLVRYEQALVTRRYIASKNPDNTLYRRDVAFTLEKIAKTKCQKHDFEGGKTAFFDALALRQDLIKSDASQTLWLLEYAETLLQIGGCLRASGDLALAGGFYALAAEKLQPVAEGDARAKQDLARAIADRDKIIAQLGSGATVKSPAAEELKAKARDALIPLLDAARHQQQQADANAAGAWNDLRAQLLRPQ